MGFYDNAVDHAGLSIPGDDGGYALYYRLGKFRRAVDLFRILFLLYQKGSPNGSVSASGRYPDLVAE